MIKMNFDAAIFDLDGTLLNSTHLWRKIDHDFFKKFNITMSETYYSEVAHLSLDEAATHTKAICNISATVAEIKQEWLDMAEYEYSNNILLKENALTYLHKLKKENIPLAIATGLPRKIFEKVLTHLEIIDLFDVLCSVDDVEKGKASPDVYLLVAEKLNVSPEKCIVFEDVYTAMKSAKKAEMTVCAVWDKESEKHSKEINELSDYYIKNWNELL